MGGTAEISELKTEIEVEGFWVENFSSSSISLFIEERAQDVEATGSTAKSTMEV